MDAKYTCNNEAVFLGLNCEKTEKKRATKNGGQFQIFKSI